MFYSNPMLFHISPKYITCEHNHFKLLLLVFIGAKKARECIFSVLRDACSGGDLTVAEAIEAAKDIFAQNAIKFYKISVGAKVFCSQDIVSANCVKIESSVLESGVSLVRIIWVDASGQHRCRVSFFFFFQ